MSDTPFQSRLPVAASQSSTPMIHSSQKRPKPKAMVETVIITLFIRRRRW